MAVYIVGGVCHIFHYFLSVCFEELFDVLVTDVK